MLRHPPSNFLLLFFVGCISGSTAETGVEDGGTEGDVMDLICQQCEDQGKLAYDCSCATGGGNFDHVDYNCAANDGAAATACDADCPTSFNTVPWPCETNTASGSCTTWAPENEVFIGTGGIYHVDEDFIKELVANSAPLWSCDDAALDPQPGGGYKVVDADAGELLYELGLRDGDVPHLLNGMPLNYISEAGEAFAALYLEGEDTYSLVVKRGGSSTTIQYVLD